MNTCIQIVIWQDFFYPIRCYKKNIYVTNYLMTINQLWMLNKNGACHDLQLGDPTRQSSENMWLEFKCVKCESYTALYKGNKISQQRL